MRGAGVCMGCAPVSFTHHPSPGPAPSRSSWVILNEKRLPRDGQQGLNSHVYRTH